MALGVEVTEMGWDLSLRAQSRRALTMTSVWLREEGEGEWELKGVEEKELILEESRRPEYHDQRTSVAIYFDVAFDQQSFRSASGLVVRDVVGNILASKSVLHSDVESPFAAEAHAGFQATKLGIDMGLQVLEIVGDSRSVIIKCQSTEQDRSMIGAIIRDIQSTKNHFQDLRFRFIPKTGNYFAHFIAKEALKRGEGQYLEGDIPSSVRIAMEKERLSIAK
ncbi:hypothetical protein CXB51_007614 [Gossypium anomalum]|uniref:RNase H type-1 domain-containing protein n=1 Tax=Gossypium anomalum TaxID=47600 RepID=A0A8J6D2M2_9ROSI|nr:hypothetical protein CXB51_007614 [Gossypium anomalum]